MISRRGFLGTLLAAVGAVALPSDVLWMPPTVAEGLPIIEPSALVGLQQITLRMAKEIAAQWQGRAIMSAGLIGQEGLRHQFNVTMESPGDIDRYGLDVERYLKPAAASLVQRLQDTRAQACGTLALPEGPYRSVRVTAKDTGVCVRGVLGYDYGFDRNLLRFDVVCG